MNNCSEETFIQIFQNDSWADLPTQILPLNVTLTIAVYGLFSLNEKAGSITCTSKVTTFWDHPRIYETLRACGKTSDSHAIILGESVVGQLWLGKVGVVSGERK